MKTITLKIHLSVIEIEPETRSQFKPNHTSNWVGSHSDLVKLATKPALLNDVCTNIKFPLAVCNDSPLPHPSLRDNYFNTIKPPKLIKGSKAFGENVRGRTKTKRKNSKTKIFDSIRKKPGKTQKCLMVWENIKMVITRLKIKTEKEIALVDI